MDQTGALIEQAETTKTPLQQKLELTIQEFGDQNVIPPGWENILSGTDSERPFEIEDPKLDRFLATKKISDAFNTQDPRVVTSMIEAINTIVKTLPFTI